MIEDQEYRSSVMRAVKGQNTTPEMTVRRMLHGMGYRYRLHAKNLPGRPDIVFAGKQKAIFVHGCFWHQHSCPRGARVPKSRHDYWLQKLSRNKQRDAENEARLQKMGWSVLVVWECETKDLDLTRAKVIEFLE